MSLGTQVQAQIILDPDYLSDYLSVSYDYVKIEHSSSELKSIFSSSENYYCLSM